ncbi:glycosyltransferase family 2 protein [Marinobacterium jannaschii]|uniref:glycosyltransferase family 2 protein n=1 Tax=Marinobacterium jannaschii TaxID=64970 RepID=UPI0004819B78|nr:glycosyltransferase family 2 protein [Marinobacterium jannaschii]
MPQAQLAVVIPVYNRETLVLETLDSVRRQDVQPDLVVIIDDGSTDCSHTNVEHWIQSHKLDPARWRLVHQVNKGLSSARNAARPFVSNMDLIVFLDSDDIWPEDFVRRAKNHFQANPDDIAASSDGVKLFYDEQGSITHRKLLPLEPNPQSFRLLRNRSPLVCATVFKLSALDSIGWFDVRIRYGEDHLLWHLIATQGSWGYLPGKPFQYRYFHNPQQPHASTAPQLTSRLRCARVLSKRLNELCDQNQLRNPDVRWAIWKTWYAAARACDKAGKKAAARRLYWEAIKADPRQIKAAAHYLRCCVQKLLFTWGK